NILFWGPLWQGSNGSDPKTWNSNNSPAQAVIDAMTGLIHSSYFHLIQQYGADPFNMFINDTRWDPSNPGATIDHDQIDDAVQNQIDNDGFPSPDDQMDGHGHHVQPIYVVVTQPGVGIPGSAGVNRESGDRPEVWVPTHNV